MNLTSYTDGLVGIINISSPGATMTGYISLSVETGDANYLIRKEYADTVFSTLNANTISSTPVNVSTLKQAVSGDVIIKTDGTTAINVSIPATTATKVTVNDKGIVTATSSIVESDIPELDWSIITSGKPTTAGGYGITDGLYSTGGTVTGNITLAADPTTSTEASTKQYVDNAVAGASASYLNIGDIIIKLPAPTPTGFLRCNGALVDKTTYSGLYSMLGDSCTPTLTQSGSGQPWRQQYDFSTTQTGDITGWAAGTSLPGPLIYTQAIVTKSRVYLLGGRLNNSWTATVYTAPINTDGTLGTWTTGTSLPGPLVYSQAIVTKNRVYLLGGYTGGAYTSIVYIAPISSDGTLGAWVTGTALPAAVNSSQAIVTKNRVYLLGGFVNSVDSSAVYTAPINTDGTLGTWSAATSLPLTVANSQVIVTKSRVYLLGGQINGDQSSTVYTATINIDGTLGTWTTGTALPATVINPQAIVTKNQVYLLAGVVDGNWSPSVYTAPINSDGTLGTWTTGTVLPGTVAYSQSIVTKNRLYLLGGYVNGNPSSTVYTATISDGLNDYSPYYDGTITYADVGVFALPDLTSLEMFGYSYYVKY